VSELRPVPKPTDKAGSGKSTPRWKRVEQILARWLMKHDGPDPRLHNKGWVSSIGRVAQTTQAGFDCLSLHYCGESKSMEKFPKWLADAWKQVIDKAKHNSKAALLYLWMPNVPPLHIITAERHAELLGYEREIEGRGA